jgi:hypothetical protein
VIKGIEVKRTKQQQQFAANDSLIENNIKAITFKLIHEQNMIRALSSVCMCLGITGWIVSLSRSREKQIGFKS